MKFAAVGIVSLLALSTVQADWIATFSISAADASSMGTIQADQSGSTWGGNLTLSNGATAATTSIFDSDGDVFIRVNAKSGYCVIDSGVNLNTEDFLISVFEQNGLVCSVKQSGATQVTDDDSTATFVIGTQSSHASDCKWTGSECSATGTIILE